jgi:hypothetical protein
MDVPSYVTFLKYLNGKQKHSCASGLLTECQCADGHFTDWSGAHIQFHIYSYQYLFEIKHAIPKSPKNYHPIVDFTQYPKVLLNTRHTQLFKLSCRIRHYLVMVFSCGFFHFFPPKLIFNDHVLAVKTNAFLIIMWHIFFKNE